MERSLTKGHFMRIILALLAAVFFSTPSWATVPNATPLKNVYSCNSATTQFPYSFPISATSDMTVYTVDSSGKVTQQVNFTVDTTNVWVVYPASGSPCATGNQLVLLPATPQTQLLSLTSRSPFVATAIGEALDKLTIIDQQLQEQINRAILSPVNQNAGSGITFPSPQANQYIGWDATGTVLVNLSGQGISPTSSPTFAGLTVTGLNGIGKYSSGILSIASADVDYTTPSGTETFTNKTFDTTGTGNVFKLAGSALLQTGVTGTGLKLMTSTGSFTTNHCLKINAAGDAVDNGSTCSGGSGMVYPASSGITVTDTSSWLTSLSEVDGDIIYGVGSAWVVQAPPTWNQNTTGTAARWTTARNLAGNSVTGAANVAFANKFIVQGTTDSGLSGPQFLGALGTGLVKNTTTTGVLSIATSGTDYAPATSGSSILYGSSGGFANVTVGTGLQFTGGTLSNTVTNANTSNVLFQYSGQVDQTGSATGEFVGSLLTPNGQTGNYRFLQSNGNAYVQIWSAKFTKISGISTVTVWTRIWQRTIGTANLKVDIGGANGSVNGTALQTTPEWKSFTIDVSGLVNGTTYDVAASLEDSASVQTAYCSNIMGFGS